MPVHSVLELIVAQDVSDRLRLSAGSVGAEPDAFALPQDPDEGPLLITSASPLRPSHPARSAEVASAASSQAGDQLRLSGSGKGMMTVVRTQFVPLSDSLSDSDSDAEVSHGSTAAAPVLVLHCMNTVHRTLEQCKAVWPTCDLLVGTENQLSCVGV